MHPMRRKDRQITDLAAIRAILESEDVLHLAMCEDSAPYVVPMSYGYELADDGTLTFYLHCAGQGRKLDMLRKNPNVCFEISRKVKLISAEGTNGWTAKYRSVIGSGRAVIEEDADDKQRALMAILRHAGYEGAPAFDPNMLAATVTIRIEAQEYAAKSNIAPGEEGSVR